MERANLVFQKNMDADNCSEANISQALLQASTRQQANGSRLQRLPHNVFGAAIGEPYEKPRAIPQGDSWSTRALAAMLIPWARRLSKRGAEPRSLADDMFARCAEDNREADLKEHLEA